MTNTKISSLTSATTPLAGTETVPLVQGGVTKKTTVNDIKFNTAPTFSAFLGTNQVVSTGQTKIQLNIKLWDTNSNYDKATNNRFTPTVAGYYQVNW